MALSDSIIVTGGAGFIGSNYILQWLSEERTAVINLDCLTYAGNLQNLSSVQDDTRYQFVHGNINDRALVHKLLRGNMPRSIVHFAAETHVDRSIFGPDEFIQTNVRGTFQLLEAAREYWFGLRDDERERFRFLHVSTDEVYGSLGPDDSAFTETSAYTPSSPYSASKAAADHLVRAYHHTYGLPTLITNCSNSYGPHQFPEKLIPLIITNALAGKPLPIYGDGLHVRDWLYVGDHCDAIRLILERGRPGETYNVSGNAEQTNLTVARTICNLLQEFRPAEISYESLIDFVKDRPGHDRRYAINSRKLESELGWKRRETFDSGIRKTISWYLENVEWINNVTNRGYQEWIRLNYEERADRS